MHVSSSLYHNAETYEKFLFSEIGLLQFVGEECKMEHISSPSVPVPKTDDETFTSFFSGVSLEKCETECLDLDESDFDMITPQSEL